MWCMHACMHARTHARAAQTHRRPFSSARPNAGHAAVRQLQELNVLSCVITQNVDALHSKAGSQDVIDLHGRSDLVRCLQCGYTESRQDYQRRLQDMNPSCVEQASELRADGDAQLSRGHDGFRVPPCPVCTVPGAAGDAARGVMKPDVVFFGDVVRGSVREAAARAVDRCSGVLLACTCVRLRVRPSVAGHTCVVRVPRSLRGRPCLRAACVR